MALLERWESYLSLSTIKKKRGISEKMIAKIVSRNHLDAKMPTKMCFKALTDKSSPGRF